MHQREKNTIYSPRKKVPKRKNNKKDRAGGLVSGPKPSNMCLFGTPGRDRGDGNHFKCRLETTPTEPGPGPGPAPAPRGAGVSPRLPVPGGERPGTGGYWLPSARQ